MRFPLLVLLIASQPLLAMCPFWPPTEFRESCAEQSPRDAVAASDLVFIGVLEKASQPKQCTLRRTMKVLKTLRGTAGKRVTVQADDGCETGCPAALSSIGGAPLPWIVFAKKRGADWELDRCRSYAVEEPLPSLEDLEARFQWKQALRAAGMTDGPWHLSSDRFFGGGASQLNAFRSAELLPKLTAWLPRFKSCLVFEPGLFPGLSRPTAAVGFSATVNKDGRLENVLGPGGESTYSEVRLCLKSAAEGALFPQPIDPRRNGFRVVLQVLKASPIESTVLMESGADRPFHVRSLLAIGAGDAPSETAKAQLLQTPQLFNQCRPANKTAPPINWRFAGRLEFDVDGGGNVVKGSAKALPFPSPFPVPPTRNQTAAADCLSAEIEKTAFPNAKAAKVSLSLHVWNDR